MPTPLDWGAVQSSVLAAIDDGLRTAPAIEMEVLVSQSSVRRAIAILRRDGLVTGALGKDLGLTDRGRAVVGDYEMGSWRLRYPQHRKDFYATPASGSRTGPEP